MSQSMLGGDPAEMQQMSAEFTKQSDQVRGTITALDREAAKVGTAWTGPGALQFREAWTSSKSAFQKMAEELSQASNVIKQYRENIEQATR
ncbi:WXG100 family type VII secretion target [Nonomuraea sp. NN258]|uniref:WXG100 family type VII secretion target n=1 Tax=Nonomuraea antri TaxID=2730852 RepID=UPI0015697BDF|nr:WXG100 family type VII secretion target [Nonomuraea antri]NRQ38062.1 WXG100 family type VII secretion target [Nonomuraea antri]